MREEIMEVLINKIAGLTQREAATLGEETNLKSDITLKSIELAAITAALEEEFDAYVKYTALMHAETIGEMADAALKEIEG